MTGVSDMSWKLVRVYRGYTFPRWEATIRKGEGLYGQEIVLYGFTEKQVRRVAARCIRRFEKRDAKTREVHV